jgi:hypothetical protein
MGPKQKRFERRIKMQKREVHSKVRRERAEAEGRAPVVRKVVKKGGASRK